MSSDSEEDYMSMDFSAAVENDVRPGLIHSSKQKRDLELLKRKQQFDAKFKTNKKKSLKVIEEEHREEGLRKPIEEDNKGFALLAKMGYKPGGGIGKTEEKQNKPTALIDINIKTSRKGLGLPERKPRSAPRANANKPSESVLLSTSGLSAFRNSLAVKQRDRKLQADLLQSQKCCSSLDKREGKTRPWKSWFWPDSEKDKTEALKDDIEEDYVDDDFREDDGSDIDDRFNSDDRIDVANDRLEIANDRLSDENMDLIESLKVDKELSDNCENNESKRAKNFGDLENVNNSLDRCCSGTKFEQSKHSSGIHSSNKSSLGDENDSKTQSCDTEIEFIQSIKSENESDGDIETESDRCIKSEDDDDIKSKSEKQSHDDMCDEEEDDEHLSVEEKLDGLTQYLRTTYFYCIWCGHEFQDKTDLSEHCPGPSSEHH